MDKFSQKIGAMLQPPPGAEGGAPIWAPKWSNWAGWSSIGGKRFPKFVKCFWGLSLVTKLYFPVHGPFTWGRKLLLCFNVAYFIHPQLRLADLKYTCFAARELSELATLGVCPRWLWSLRQVFLWSLRKCVFVILQENVVFFEKSVESSICWALPGKQFNGVYFFNSIFEEKGDPHLTAI